MIRQLLTFASILSFLMFLMTASLCARSYYKDDWYHKIIERTSTWSIQIEVSRGKVLVRGWCVGQTAQKLFQDEGIDHDTESPQDLTLSAGQDEDVQLNNSLMFLKSGRDMAWQPYFDALFPIWSMTLALLFLPVTRLLLSRRRPTYANWQCCKCRYNLTGNTSGICPECGTPVTDQSSAPT